MSRAEDPRDEGFEKTAKKFCESDRAPKAPSREKTREFLHRFHPVFLMRTKSTLNKFEQERRQGIGRLLLMSRRDFLVRLDGKLREHGLPNYPQMSIGAYVDSSGTPSVDIASRMGVTKQAVARMVRDLEDLGLVVQIPHPLDRRSNLVKFTPAGLRYLKRMHGLIDQIQKEYEVLLGTKRFEVTREALHLISYGSLLESDHR